MDIGTTYANWVIKHVDDEKAMAEAISRGKKINMLLSQDKIDEAHNEFLVISKLYKIPIPPEIDKFFKNIREVKVIHSDSYKDEKFPQAVYEMIIQRISKAKDKKEFVFELNRPVSYKQVLKVANKVWATEGKLIYIISNNDILDGRIISDMNSYENVEVIKGYHLSNSKGESHFIVGFGEFKNVGRSQPSAKITLRMRKYLFKSKDNITYVVFSRTPLKIGRCKLIGMSLSVYDRRKIGEESKNVAYLDVFIVNEYEPYILQITEDKAVEYKTELNIHDHDSLMKYMFGEYRHPRWFETFMFSVVVSRKAHQYPSHVLIIGKAGSGKTRGILMPLKISLDEPTKIVSGSSTIKGLIPNFKENPPSEGHLCRSEKISLVDEFFNFIINHTNKNNVVEFSQLKDVLDAEEKEYISGNGGIIVKMNAVMIATTNIKETYGLTSVSSICANMDRPFLSRMIIYNQSEQHTEFVNNRKYVVNDMDSPFPQYNPKFVNLIEFLTNTRIKGIDIKKIREIFDKYHFVIPTVSLEVYEGRYQMHIANLVNGVCKYRWLIGDKSKLEYDDKDYKMADDIFGNIISTWIEDKQMIKRLPARVRLGTLNSYEKRVYDYLCNEFLKVNIACSVLSNYMNIPDGFIREIIASLESKDVIKTVVRGDSETYYVPFWYGRGDNNEHSSESSES